MMAFRMRKRSGIVGILFMQRGVLEVDGAVQLECRVQGVTHDVIDFDSP